VEADGGPLAAIVAAANVHDTKMLEATIEAIVVERPQITEDSPQHLCLVLQRNMGSRIQVACADNPL